jgi:hypothetical protein
MIECRTPGCHLVVYEREHDPGSARLALHEGSATGHGLHQALLNEDVDAAAHSAWAASCFPDM